MGTPSNRRRWVRAARLVAYCVAALAAVLLAAALYLPDVLDTPAARAEIQRQLSTVIRGELAWERLSVRLLPRPHGALRNFRLERPGVGTVSAEAFYVQLRLWPLIRGRAEIASLTVVRPVITIDIVPAAAVEETAQEKPIAPGVVEFYRSAVSPAVDIAGRFAPDTVLTVDNATIDIRVAGVPPIQLSKFSLYARTWTKGLELDATTASDYWGRLTLSMHLDPGELSGAARLEIADVKPAVWLDHYSGGSPVGITVSGASLRARARTDGRNRLECDLDLRAETVAVARGAQRVEIPGVELRGKITAAAQDIAFHLGEARLGASRLTGGALRYSLEDGALAGEVEYDLDLAQGMDYTRRLGAEEAGAALGRVQSIAGRAQGRVKLAFGRGDWSVGVDVVKSDAALQIRNLPGPVRLAGGALEMDGHAVKASRVAVSMPAGEVLLSKLHHSLNDGATAAEAEFDLDFPNSMELVRRALPEESREPLSVIQSVAGRARGTAKLAFARGDWSAGVEIVKSDAQVQVRDLPGPASLAGGSVRITPTSVNIERAALTLLDATAIASATISEFKEGPRVQGRIAEAVIGEKFLDWAWELGKAPPHLKLKAPVRAAVSSFAWGPKQALDVQATARFDAGPSVAVALGWTPAALEVRRAAIQDERSDAVMNARIAGPQLVGRFSGSLSISSIAAMLKSATVRGGRMSGDLRLTIDREDARRTSAEGSLKGEALDLAWLIGRPVRIERIDLAVDGEVLRIGDATVDWAGQRATLRGEVRRGEGPPVIDAHIDSPGLVVDALRGAGAAATDAKPAVAAAPSKPLPAAADDPPRIWPLPVTGRIEIRSDFVQSGRHKVAPVAATLLLEERRAHLDLKQAEICGISLPLSIEATPKGIAASAQITAQKQPLQQAAHCLADQGVLITGDFDLQADLTTEGKAGELVRNLKGTVHADMRDGKVMKFALLGNILSMGDIAALLEKDGPRLDDTGFPYRSVKVAGHFQEGRFIVEEGAFSSDAVGLAATGWISLLDYGSRLTVLVAPFGRIDHLVRKVPILGYVIGGTFTSVPVGVSGDIRDPRVVPLAPEAVTSEVLGIFERTLKLPAKLVTPEEK